jgi:hypothetical protein
MKNSATDDRKRLDNLIDKLRGTVEALEASDRVGAIVFWRAGLNFEEETTHLKSLLQRSIDVRNELGASGRKRNFFLTDILWKLKSLYLEAGGTKTGISRTNIDETRESPFLSFAFSALQQVSQSARPKTLQALASDWERNRHEIAQASPNRPLTPLLRRRQVCHRGTLPVPWHPTRYVLLYMYPLTTYVSSIKW